MLELKKYCLFVFIIYLEDKTAFRLYDKNQYQCAKTVCFT